ncbi:MAG TPA: hypothetical protein VN066_10660 [Rhodocyclaceae bacterium]|nr:hypothetical protein [Rhodocyclaceae bacterium]
MNHPEKSGDTVPNLVVYFQSEMGLRSRSASPLAPHHILAIPQPPARVLADWDREVAEMGLEIGDIETLPLARTILRWPDYPRCAETVSGWMQALGLPDLLDPNDIALMACRGTHYHHDSAQYGNAAFCNLFLSEDKGLDLHFAALGLRIPLRRGTVVIFDTAQPHAVIPRDRSGFDAADLRPDQDCTQVFLTWEMPIENAQLRRVLKIDLDVDPAACLKLDEQQLRLNGEIVAVCPATGRWQAAD